MSFSAKGRDILKRVDNIVSEIENAKREIKAGRTINRAPINKKVSELVKVVDNVKDEFKRIVLPLVNEFNKSPNNVHFGREEKTGIFRRRAKGLTLIKMPTIMEMDNIIKKLEDGINKKKISDLNKAKAKAVVNEGVRKAEQNAAERAARDKELKELNEMNRLLKRVRNEVGNDRTRASNDNDRKLQALLQPAINNVKKTMR